MCFVPEAHLAQEKLPAVSGSSGHLVVERLHSDEPEPHWPGQVFAEAELDYRQVMQGYVEATQDRLVRRSNPREPKAAKPLDWREAMVRRLERFQRLEQRKREDAGWKAIRKRHHTIVVAYQALSRRRRKEQQAAWQAELVLWNQVKAQRKARLAQRRQENQLWHQRQRPPATQEAAHESRVWIAILVVTDNCTRQCLALPVFRSGAKLTSEELVAALRWVLPVQLEFLISDQGTHFRSKAFAQLAQEADFIHVPVYRHRPESNGIAERFVLTLKQWLRDKPWQTIQAVELLLTQFQVEYNDRPHQGLAIPGLSPNEFANRIWLM